MAIYTISYNVSPHNGRKTTIGLKVTVLCVNSQCACHIVTPYLIVNCNVDWATNCKITKSSTCLNVNKLENKFTGTICCKDASILEKNNPLPQNAKKYAQI